jgi:5,10-methylenetetrahydrofolate reductase
MTIAGKSMVTANFLTPDSPDKVIAFYKDKAGPNAQTMTTGAGGMITMQNGSSSVTVTVSQSASENNGETQITIVNTSSSS